MGLRLSSGVDVAAVCEAFGEDFEPRRSKLEQWAKDGFVEHNGRFVRLTPKGANVHSEISARLL